MRTTLTVDDDIAAEIEQLRRERNASLKDVINEALRRGVRDLRTPPKPRKPFRLRTFDMGEPRFPIDNVAEAIAYAEGDDHK